MNYVFLTACRNEALIIDEFMREFLAMVHKAGIAGKAILHIVDDLSVDRSPEMLDKHRIAAAGVVDVRIIRAPTNLGNQAALFYGLRHLDIAPDDVLITFDCDGEDDVHEIPSLLELGRQNPGKLVLVERGRRQESLAFRVSFLCYKALYRFLTRHSVIPNNFMLIPAPLVPVIRRSPLGPAHFAYAILKLGFPSVKTRRDRRRRYGGSSSQNLFSLASHGLVGLMVFYENVIAKLLVLLLGFGVSALAVIGLALAVRDDVPAQRTLLWVAVAFAGVVVGLFGVLLSSGLALLLKLAAFNTSQTNAEAQPTPRLPSASVGAVRSAVPGGKVDKEAS